MPAYACILLRELKELSYTNMTWIQKKKTMQQYLDLYKQYKREDLMIYERCYESWLVMVWSLF